MKRLTNKNQILDGYIGADVIKKLSDLEDIEEELGIDLVTLFKALKHKIWIKTPFGYKDKWLCSTEGLFYSNSRSGFKINERLLTKDYGKTWALTKEKLEK